MKLETLGAKSYLSLAPYDAEIVYADKYISMRTRNNSNFYWGKLLLRTPASSITIWTKLGSCFVGRLI